MRYAVIDIGANTFRMSVFAASDGRASALFTKKITVGLASYVHDGELPRDGIDAACDALIEMRGVLAHIDIDAVYAFATASLRNITNSDDARREISSRVGIDIEILAGDAEARYGLIGARSEIDEPRGVLIDIGGGSTEVTAFDEIGVVLSRSFPIGCLSLWTRCVRRSILPNEAERRAMIETLCEIFDDISLRAFGKHDTIYAVGGTARAALAIAAKLFSREKNVRAISRGDLREVRRILSRGARDGIDLLLRVVPERAHTTIPGVMILTWLMKHLGADSLRVCTSGIRDGYLAELLARSC